MLLIINTTPKDYLEIILATKRDDFKIHPIKSAKGGIPIKSGLFYRVKKIPGRYNQAEKLMPAIDKLLSSQKVPPKKLTGLGVVTGPGGFTSVRIGVACANTLSWSLDLPLAGIRADQFDNHDDLVAKIFEQIKKLPKGKLVMPFYDREPNITKVRK